VLLLGGCTDETDDDTDDGATPPDTDDTSAPPTDSDTDTDSTNDTDTDTDPGTGDPVLTVVNGFGGGVSFAGETRHVWADVDPQLEIASFTGDADLLDAAGEWNAGLVMPDHDVTVEAVIEAVPLTFDERVYNTAGRNRDVLVVEAAIPIGVVLFFHGAAYSIDQLRTNAGTSLAMHLVRAGYTVAALESEMEAVAGTGGWSATLGGNNDDLENVQDLIADLSADGTLPAGMPVYAWGKSSGGIFAHTVGAAGLVNGVVAFCAAGTDDAMAVTQAPTAWYLADFDQTIPTAVADAMDDQVDLTNRGVTTDLYVHPQTPLYDQRFERVTGVDATTSATLAQQIRDEGYVDANDLWTVPGIAVNLDFPGFLSAAQITAIEAEIEMMASDHELYDDVGARMVEFLAGL
jgi:hypothetical protein